VLATRIWGGSIRYRQEGGWRPQNSRRQRDDMNQISYRGPTNVRYHRTKFSRLSDVAPGIYALLVANPKLNGFRIPDRSFF